MRVALLGLGLIGGSIARAVGRDRPDWPITAWSPSGDGPAAAADAGLVTTAPSVEAAVEGAELVVLCGPPLACLELIDTLGGPIRGRLAAGAVVTDVASTKSAIVVRADEAALPFVGGHPMAGRESSGFAAADADLFRDRPWVVVAGRHATAADAARVEELARACGARPVTMTAADHDAAVAAISHLPLVLAAALVEAVAGGEGSERRDWAMAAGLASSGWQGMTRLARGDVEMGAGIVATNAGPIADRIRDLRDVLDAWLADLGGGERRGAGGPDSAAIAARLAAARRRLEEGP
ncbi:MAG TPA: prephenate dehydrogenase/arogenate dehydrogenase family protein [Candidatus Limnocylindrales bacterium]|nr:prephenate dehydrogenase/arogenate dehydrogenase family protein [Candidatus Limnocylindrales bacterium]